jgi:hypothetical protein
MSQAHTGASLRMQILHRFDKCFSGAPATLRKTETRSATAVPEAKSSLARTVSVVAPMPRRAPEPSKSVSFAGRVERHLLDESAWIRQNGY